MTTRICNAAGRSGDRGNWPIIARNDLARLTRSPAFWAATVVVVLASVAGAAIPSVVQEEPAYMVGVETLFIALGTIGPFIALGLGYRAIVGEFESKRLRVLVGLPNTRRDIVLGKMLSRVTAIVLVTGVGAFAGLVTILVRYEDVAVGGAAVVAAGLVSIFVVYVVLAVAVSASMTAGTKAVAGCLGVYLLLFWGWNYLAQAVHWLIAGSVPAAGNQPAWYVLLIKLNPGTAIGDLTIARYEWMQEGEYVSNQLTADRVAGEAPMYLSDPVAALVILAWLVVPVALAVRRFRRLEPL